MPTATTLFCLILLGGLVPKSTYDIPELHLKSDPRLQLRPATESDIKSTTTLIHSTYSYWVENGIVVAPATQSEDKTRSHLLNGKGFVVTDQNNQIVATFSLDDTSIEEKNSTITLEAENGTELQ